MSFFSGKKTAIAADTPEGLTDATGNIKYAWIDCYLEETAAGEARFGPTASVASKIGERIEPGQTLRILTTDGPNPYNTVSTMFAFTAISDIMSYSGYTA